jgi:phage terminase large subunit
MEYVIDFLGKLGPRYRVYERDGDTITLLTPVFEDGTGFPTEKQVAFFDSQTSHTLFGGGRGGGKSYAIMWDCIFTAYRVPGSRQIVFRRTMGELQKSIIDIMKKLPEGLRGVYHGDVSNTRFELPNGSVIYFASAADQKSAEKLLSGEYLRIYFDEWSLFPWEMWSFITGSCRSTTEKDTFGRPIIAQVKGATNPGGIGGDTLNHLFGCEIPKGLPNDLKEQEVGYDPEDYFFIPALVGDNPAYDEKRPAGRAYRKFLKSQTKAIREAWLNGKWSGFEGQYYDCYDSDVTKVKHDFLLGAMAKQYWQPIWIHIDWGQVHHAYAAWSTLLDVNLFDGKRRTLVVTYKELLIKGLSERALAEEIIDLCDDKEIKRIAKILLSPETFGESIRSRARNMGDVFVTQQLPRPQKANNERVNGWRHMYTLLSERNVLPTPYGKTDPVIYSDWIISERCPHALETIPWIMSDPHRDGDIISEGSNSKLDVADGLRYGMYSNFTSRQMPSDEKYKETVSALPVGPAGSMARYAAYLNRLKELRSGEEMGSRTWAKSRHPRISQGARKSGA